MPEVIDDEHVKAIQRETRDVVVRSALQGKIHGATRGHNEDINRLEVPVFELLGVRKTAVLNSKCEIRPGKGKLHEGLQVVGEGLIRNHENDHRFEFLGRAALGVECFIASVSCLRIARSPW